MVLDEPKKGWHHLRGRFAIKQSDFKIAPYSTGLGAIGVADELTIFGDLWVRPETPLAEPAFLCLVQSILGALPQAAFHRDGSLRSVLERRVSSRTLRDEPLPASLLDALISESANSTAEVPDTVPFPGISFSKLRRRPK